MTTHSAEEEVLKTDIAGLPKVAISDVMSSRHSPTRIGSCG